MLITFYIFFLFLGNRELVQCPQSGSAPSSRPSCSETWPLPRIRSRHAHSAPLLLHARCSLAGMHMVNMTKATKGWWYLETIKVHRGIVGERGNKTGLSQENVLKCINTLNLLTPLLQKPKLYDPPSGKWSKTFWTHPLDFQPMCIYGRNPNK